MKRLAKYWHIDRWRKSTAFTDMNAEEQGLYRNLLDEVDLREDDVIPEGSLSKASGDPVAWARSGKRVLEWMKRVPGGWTNLTAQEVKEKGIELSKSQSDKVKKRWEAERERAKADTEGHTERHTEPIPEGIPNECRKDTSVSVSVSVSGSRGRSNGAVGKVDQGGEASPTGAPPDGGAPNPPPGVHGTNGNGNHDDAVGYREALEDLATTILSRKPRKNERQLIESWRRDGIALRVALGELDRAAARARGSRAERQARTLHYFEPAVREEHARWRLKVGAERAFPADSAQVSEDDLAGIGE